MLYILCRPLTLCAKLLLVELGHFSEISPFCCHDCCTVLSLFPLLFLWEGGWESFAVRSQKKNRLCRRVEWQRPIFPRGYPLSIVRAGRLNFRVRDGNGCFPSAIVTTPPACTDGSMDFSWWR